MRIYTEPIGSYWRVVLEDEYGIEIYEEVAVDRERATKRAYEFAEATGCPALITR